jgi:hypothetical protein
MKKVFIFLAFSAVIMCTSSCRFIHETFYSPEECAEWYLEQIDEASMSGDMAKAAELTTERMEWYAGLSIEEQMEADRAASSWF